MGLMIIRSGGRCQPVGFNRLGLEKAHEAASKQGQTIDGGKEGGRSGRRQFCSSFITCRQG